MKLKHYLRGLGLGIIVSTLIVSAGKSGRAAELSNEEIKEKAKQLGMVDENEMLLSQAQSLAKEAAQKDDEKKAQQKDDSMEVVSDNASEKKETISADSQKNTESENKAVISSGSAKSDSSDDDGLMAGSFLGAGAGSAETFKKQLKPEPQKEEKKEEKKEEEKPEETAETVTVAELESRNSDAGRASENEKTVNEASNEQNDTTSRPAVNSSPVSVTIVKGESSTAVAKKLQNAGVITDAAQFDSYLCLNGFDRKLVTGAHTIPAGASARDVAEIITGR